MKFTRLLCAPLLSFSLVFQGCTSTPEPEKELSEEETPNVEINAENSDSDDAEEATAESVWAVYEGTLGLYEQQIVMELVITGEKVSGSYFYAKHQKLIQLDGTFDPAKQRVQATESYKGKTTGYLDFYVEKGELTGKWMKKAGAKDQEDFSARMVSIAKEDYAPKFEEYDNPHEVMVYNGSEEGEEMMDANNVLKLTKIGKGYFTFYYSVVGANAHMGTVEGLGETQNGVGFFEGEEACRLEFKFGNKTVEVEEAQPCDYYRGARAYFDGKLTRKP